MKKLLIITGLFLSGTLFAQDIEPKFVEKGDLVKGIYYFDDGQVKQEGTYKDGKLHGKWIAYNKKGDKIAVATYQNGKKTGKWFFWTKGNLLEVDYSNNQIAQVTRWENTGLLAEK